MNEASRWRLALARQIAAAYIANSNVAAVIAAGSTAGGYADRWSDIELDVFWTALPSDEERLRAVERAGGVIWHLYPRDPDDPELSEDYHVHGVKVDLSNFALDGVEQILAKVVDQADTSFSKQVIVSHLQHAVVFSGPDVIAHWQARTAAYPEALRRAMVRESLSFTPWWGKEMLTERGDLLLLYESVVSIVKKILMVLMGINRIYHPGFKWVDRLIAEMPVAPPDLAARLHVVFSAEPATALAELRRLVEETFALVHARMPDVDTSAAQEWFQHRRQPQDAPPISLSL